MQELYALIQQELNNQGAETKLDTASGPDPFLIAIWDHLIMGIVIRDGQINLVTTQTKRKVNPGVIKSGSDFYRNKDLKHETAELHIHDLGTPGFNPIQWLNHYTKPSDDSKTKSEADHTNSAKNTTPKEHTSNK